MAIRAEEVAESALKSVSGGLAGACEHLGGEAKPARKPRARKVDKTDD